MQGNPFNFCAAYTFQRALGLLGRHEIAEDAYGVNSTWPVTFVPTNVP
jgi:hypothetical protein